MRDLVDRQGRTSRISGISGCPWPHVIGTHRRLPFCGDSGRGVWELREPVSVAPSASRGEKVSVAPPTIPGDGVRRNTDSLRDARRMSRWPAGELSRNFAGGATRGPPPVLCGPHPRRALEESCNGTARSGARMPARLPHSISSQTRRRRHATTVAPAAAVDVLPTRASPTPGSLFAPCTALSSSNPEE